MVVPLVLESSLPQADNTRARAATEKRGTERRRTAAVFHVDRTRRWPRSRLPPASGPSEYGGTYLLRSAAFCLAS